MRHWSCRLTWQIPLISDQKRQLTLADRLIFSLPGYIKDGTTPVRWGMQKQEALIKAKKFVLDSQAAFYLGTMIRHHPGIIADAQDFAIPPFPQCWIELPFRAFYIAVTGEIPDSTSDEIVGYLFDGPVVTPSSFATNTAGKGDEWKAVIMPLEYVLNRPFKHREMVEVQEELGISRLGLDIFFWGESARGMLTQTTDNVPIGNLAHAKSRQVLYNAESTGDGPGALHALRDNHSFRMVQHGKLNLQHGKLKSKEIFEMLYNGSAGDLRNIIALLLFLNRTQDIQIRQDMSWHPKIVNRMPKRLMPHTTIKLRLDPGPRLKSLSFGQGTKKRLHDVRGHYMHDQVARRGCLHGAETKNLKEFGTYWEEYEPLKWKCRHCSGKRWWRREHSRGNEELGTVVQRYSVTR